MISIETSKAQPIGRPRCAQPDADRHIMIEIEPLAHRISSAIPKTCQMPFGPQIRPMLN